MYSDDCDFSETLKRERTREKKKSITGNFEFRIISQ